MGIIDCPFIFLPNSPFKPPSAIPDSGRWGYFFDSLTLTIRNILCQYKIYMRSN